MGKKTILVIDDHDDTRLVVCLRLRKQGYETVVAADAVQAVAMARQTKPDAIILDLGLPGGSGFVVLERLKMNVMLRDIPVIILTADESADSEVKGMQAGVAAFLRKPVREETLIPAVARVIAAGEPLIEAPRSFC